MFHPDDQRFIEAAARLGMLTPQQAEAAVRAAAEAERQGRLRTVAEALANQGALQADQIRRVLEEIDRRILPCAECGVRWYVARGPEGDACPRCGGRLGGSGLAGGLALNPAGLQPGQSLGHYDILEMVGAGGMSTVYRARDKRNNAVVALKVFSGEHFVNVDPGVLKRFQREAAVAARLDCPYIVRVHECDRIEDRHYIDMEFVDGPSLGGLLARYGPLPPRQAAFIMRQVATALDVAHRNGVIHRDLKPDNILLGWDGRGRVTDFGLAKSADESVALTTMGQVLGTPYYMSPEVILGHAVTAQSDIYSLGCAFYEALTGRPPFLADSPAKVMAMHRTDSPPDPAGMVAETPREMAALVRAMMAKDPADRPASAADLVARLDGMDLCGQAFLALVDAGEGQHRIPLQGREILLGRSPQAQVFMVDGRVSKLHARILRRAGVWAVEDCGSRNGTWVNEMRIAERGLWPGDAVRAGRTVFLYLESGFRAEAWLESASARCWLTGQAGSVQGRNIPLTDKPLLIGRDEVASVRIEDEGIAPFHAQVVITRIGAQLLNLGAPSGVRVNEQEARKVVLADGDVVAVGGARFRFSSAAADAFPPDRRKPPTGARWAEAVRGDKTVIMHETPTPEEDDLDFLPDEETAMDQPGS